MKRILASTLVLMLMGPSVVSVCSCCLAQASPLDLSWVRSASGCCEVLDLGRGTCSLKLIEKPISSSFQRGPSHPEPVLNLKTIRESSLQARPLLDTGPPDRFPDSPLYLTLQVFRL